MTTLVSPQIEWMADQYVHHCGFASAVLSGIQPDPRHLDRGGYHCSVEDLRAHGNADDYSNTRPDDHNFNIKYGAAVDVSMSPADMRLHYQRIHAVWADMSDPRRKYFNAVNTWDGSGDAVRLDFVRNTAGYASPDHKWHVHDETRRRYLLDPVAARAKVSVWRGDTKAMWLASLQQEDDMTPDEVRAAVKTEIAAALPAIAQAVAGYKVNVAPGAKTPNLQPWASVDAYGSPERHRIEAKVTALGTALLSAVNALAAKDLVDEQALAAGVAAAVVAALPADRDDITAAELEQAVIGALRSLAAPPAATVQP